MKEKIYTYICSNCGQKFLKWQGQCPNCHSWNTIIPIDNSPSTNYNNYSLDKAIKPISFSELPQTKITRIKTFSEEFNRVLGGGLVKGSVSLIGGEPGIGKSSFVLKIIDKIPSNFKTIYITTEESIEQLTIHIKRLKINPQNNVAFLFTVNFETIMATITNEKPDILIIDSIQGIKIPNGSNFKDTVYEIIEQSKAKAITTILIGHITKEGIIAGPKLIEHMVDTVIYFDQTENHYNILRATKNRFGSTNEIGIFEMGEHGPIDIKNPSTIFLSENSIIPDSTKDSFKPNNQYSGTIITTILTGNRVIFTEIEALISQSYLSMPRRTIIGYDAKRTSMLIAIIEKYLHYNLSSYDIYINIAGGITTKDTSLDLALINAILSNYNDKPISTNTIIMGEVSLTGRTKEPQYLKKRIQEAKRLGFKKFIIPKLKNHSIKNITKNIEVIEIEHIEQLKEFLYKSPN